MTTLQLTILNAQDANDPQGLNNPFGTTIVANAQFNLLSNGQPVASALTDANGNLSFAVDDSWTNLSLAVDINTYDQLVQSCAQVIAPFIPAAPFYPPAPDFSFDLNYPAVQVSTPFGSWQQSSNPGVANTVSYAVSFFSLTGESPLGPWSPAYQFTDTACPVIIFIPACPDAIPDTQGVGRNIYRQFVIDGAVQPPLLVARIMNNTDSMVQDLMP